MNYTLKGKILMVFPLLFLLILSFNSTTFAVPQLTDIEESAYTEAISELVSIGVMQGFPDGSFKPDETTTRAQAAKIISFLLGRAEEVDEKDATVKTIFPDVETGHWAAGYINICVEEGIIRGFPDGSFGPSQTVTQRQLVALMLRLLGYDTLQKPLEWEKEIDETAQELGLITWEYKPDLESPREILAQASYNAIQAVPMATGSYLAEIVKLFEPLFKLKVTEIE